MAIGAFSSYPIDYRSRLIYTTPPKLAPTAPTPIPVKLIAARPPAPTPIKTPPPPIIDYVYPTTAIPATPTTTTGAAGGSTTGAASGGTGTTDTSRLLDMIAGAFQPQEVSGSLAPTSVTSTSTAEPTSGGGMNPMLLVVGVVVIGGIYWYTKKKAAA